MENVFTGRDEASAISPTTTLESTPPERNAPSGTSLIMCEVTASFSTARSASAASAADPVNVSSAPTAQYRFTSARPSLQRRKWPGGSLRTFLNIDRSRGVYRKER